MSHASASLCPSTFCASFYHWNPSPLLCSVFDAMPDPMAQKTSSKSYFLSFAKYGALAYYFTSDLGSMSYCYAYYWDLEMTSLCMNYSLFYWWPKFLYQQPFSWKHYCSLEMFSFSRSSAWLTEQVRQALQERRRPTCLERYQPRFPVRLMSTWLTSWMRLAARSLCSG